MAQYYRDSRVIIPVVGDTGGESFFVDNSDEEDEDVCGWERIVLRREREQRRQQQLQQLQQLQQQALMQQQQQFAFQQPLQPIQPTGMDWQPMAQCAQAPDNADRPVPEHLPAKRPRWS